MPRRPLRHRVAIVAGLILVIAASHWLTPTGVTSLHLPHVILRKLFVLPVMLGALWFGLRGSLLAALAVAVAYLPHVAWQWTGQMAENTNQLGEVGSLWILAVLAGVLVEREKRAQDLAEAVHRGALAALVAALDARERRTEQHSIRVAAYARRLGEGMGLDEKTLEQLALAATVHDIGKIGVPDRILLKVGPLDDEELRVIRRHPEIGRRILEEIPVLGEIAEIVHSHHERWDGGGYPRGLVGEEIPLCARVFAVVDAYDALTSERPYQRAVDHETALREINSASGSQFDERVVAAFSTIPERDWLVSRTGVASSAP